MEEKVIVEKKYIQELENINRNMNENPLTYKDVKKVMDQHAIEILESLEKL